MANKLNFPCINKLEKMGFVLMSTTLRYGSDTVVLMASDEHQVYRLCDMFSDGGDDPCYLEGYLRDISKWYPVAFSNGFSETLYKLEHSLQQVEQDNIGSSEYSDALYETEYTLKKWYDASKTPERYSLPDGRKWYIPDMLKGGE